VDTCRAGRADGGDRARPEATVLPDQGAVEVARDCGDVAGKAGWEDQPVDSTTY
jgi:hypothetical protein